ncbi:MAG TPA: CerR family C-terminal domain-containing protein [Vicinamibacterales bacterium]|nr:CerR family C-terminal domain-containing protein [Vicinamibacterales bacterium]
MNVTAAVTRQPKTNAASADTRQRLIDAAAKLFADRGFANVTVREICKASNANVAAVNYHFGDKAGLYRAVVTLAISVMLETNELSQRAGEGRSPEDQIRGFVRVFVTRLTGDGPTSWIHRLMAREFEHPTEALDLVLTQVVRPRLEYLSNIAGAYMGLPAGDLRVTRSIGSMQMQCIMAARQVPAPIEKAFGPAMRDLDATIHHITEFTLGGMRAIAAAK